MNRTSKLGAFIKLDFVTVKPYMAPKNLLLYAAVILFIPFATSSAFTSLGVGMMLAVQTASYPFALGEKSNMDALYPTLGIDRKTVVLGRYIFAIVMDLLLSAAAFLVASGAMAVTGRFSFEGVETLAVILVLMFAFIFIQAIQLALFFKVGYSKAKLLSVIPYIVIMIAASVATNMEGFGDATAFISSVLSSPVTLSAVLVLLLCLVLFVSYILSLRFYRTREF